MQTVVNFKHVIGTTVRLKQLQYTGSWIKSSVYKMYEISVDFNFPEFSWYDRDQLIHLLFSTNFPVLWLIEVLQSYYSNTLSLAQPTVPSVSIMLTLWTQSLYSTSPLHLSRALVDNTNTKLWALRMLFRRLLSNFPASSFSTSMKTVKLRSCRWTLSKLKMKRIETMKKWLGNSA